MGRPRLTLRVNHPWQTLLKYIFCIELMMMIDHFIQSFHKQSKWILNGICSSAVLAGISLRVYWADGLKRWRTTGLR